MGPSEPPPVPSEPTLGASPTPATDSVAPLSPAPDRTRQTTAGFDRARLVVGFVALALYCVLPAMTLPGSDALTIWLHAIWLVPAAVVAAGLVLGPRRFGAVAVLVGSLLLSFTTLFFFMMLLVVLMVGCQVTLMAIAIVGIAGTGRSRWGFWRWALVLLIPVVLTGALQIVVQQTVWQPEGVEVPLASSAIWFGTEGEGPAGPQEFAGVDEFPWEITGTYKSSIAEAMQAQRSVLEDNGWSVSVGPSGETHGAMTARKSEWEATLTFKKVPGDIGSVVIRLAEI